MRNKERGMNMKRFSTAIIVHLLIAALYSFVLFVCSNSYPIELWISFGFAIMAILISCIGWLNNDQEKHAGYYSLPKRMISVFYMIVGITVGAVSTLCSFSIKVIVITNVSALIVYLIVSILLSKAISYIKVLDKEHEKGEK